MIIRRAAVIIAATSMVLNCKPRGDESTGSAVKAEAAVDAADGPALDVNDVSILFEKAGPGTFYPDIDINSVLPKQTFNSLMQFAQGNTPIETSDQGTVRFGQFILPAGYVSEVNSWVAKAAGNAAKIKVTLNEEPKTRTAKEIAIEMVLGRVTCEAIKKSGAKLCTDSFAKLNYQGQRDAILDQHQWKIVGMRMDLCAGAHNEKAERCEVEFRLIAQPYGDFAPIPPAKQGAPAPNSIRAPGSRGPFMFDVAAHLLYKIGFLDLTTGNIVEEPGSSKVVAKVTELIQDLQTIKLASPVSTDGRPLGVHPGLKKEATTGSGTKLGRTIQQIIQKYTRDGSAYKLTNVTTMQLAGPVNFDSTVWVFFQGTVEPAPDYSWIPTTITGGDGIWSIRTASVLGKTGRFFPPTELHSKRKSIDHIFDYEAKQAVPTEHQDLPSFFDNPGHYGDPKLKINDTDVLAASVRNTDCISCHMTSPRAIERTIKSANGKNQPRPSLYQPPVGTTAYVSLEAMPRVDYSLRNFGYFLPPPFNPNLKGTEVGTGAIFNFPGKRVELPAVMPRVANESAELVNLINSRYLKKPNPGMVCDGEDPAAALAASTPISKVYGADAQAVIRRDVKNQVAVFDCMLHEGFKKGGSFEDCASRCGATANPNANGAGGGNDGGEQPSDAF